MKSPSIKHYLIILIFLSISIPIFYFKVINRVIFNDKDISKNKEQIAGVYTALPSNLFTEDFSGVSVLEESGTIQESTNPDWSLSSGGWFYFDNGIGKTIQGELSENDKWRIDYSNYNPIDTDNGYHPQNIFRLEAIRSKWKNYRQEVYYRIKKYNLSSSPERRSSNGLLLFNRYQDSNNLYYLGIRVDGYATIKKKVNGTYYTLYQQPFDLNYSSYNRETNPNLLPINIWIGLRSEVKTNNDNTVELKLYMDNGRTGDWKLVAQAIDDGVSYGGAPILADGYGGIRTDFMDVEFSNFNIEDIDNNLSSSSSSATSTSSSSIMSSSSSSGFANSSSLSSSSSSMSTSASSSSSVYSSSSSVNYSSSVSAGSSSSFSSSRGKSNQKSSRGGKKINSENLNLAEVYYSDSESNLSNSSESSQMTESVSPIAMYKYQEDTVQQIQIEDEQLVSSSSSSEKEDTTNNQEIKIPNDKNVKSEQSISYSFAYSSENVNPTQFNDDIQLKSHNNTVSETNNDKEKITILLSSKFGVGMSSEEVKVLQTLLAKDPEIYSEKDISGFYGEETIRAVQKFQKKYNLITSGTPDTTGFGLAGPKTREKISEVFASSSSSSSQKKSVKSDNNTSSAVAYQSSSTTIPINLKLIEIIRSSIIDFTKKISNLLEII